MAERRNSDPVREPLRATWEDQVKEQFGRVPLADDDDIITVSGILSGVDDLDNEVVAGSTYTKYLQEKVWYVDLLPGDADLTDVTIWFYDQANAVVQGEEGTATASKTSTPTAPTPRTITVATTLVSTDTTVLADASSAAFTITLPPAAYYPGIEYLIKKIDSVANAVTISPHGDEAVDGESSIVLRAQYEAVTLRSDGAQWWIMTSTLVRSYGIDASQGLISGVQTVNKFGRATDCDASVITDIWDGADGVTSTDVWLAPTAARIHDIVSTSTLDTAAGTGGRTIRIHGLPDWDSKEVSEDIVLNGTTNVPTVNSYVIIHRMYVLTWGSTSTNQGKISATAQTDATITAVIKLGSGQTLMAIYGLPSTQTFHMTGYMASVLRLSGAAVEVDGSIVSIPAPDVDPVAFRLQEVFNFEDLMPWRRVFTAPKKFAGPAIIKMRASASANNSQCSAAFDGYLVDN